MNSAIYQGTVRHRRMLPNPHQFSYRMFMLYLDLDELAAVFKDSRLFSSEGKALAQFRRRDHLGDPDRPLVECVRDRVEQETGQRPQGPIRLLTHLRYFGYVFNPVSFYYCFDSKDEKLECILAEVNNTPWGEQYCYVLACHDDKANGRLHRWQPVKAMHVSPFMPMDIQYDWRFMQPGKQLNVHMENHQAGKDGRGNKLFDATLTLQRQAITASALRRVLLRFPFMTLRIILAIHWQALRLWIKRTPVFDHPGKSVSSSAQRHSEGSVT